MAYERTSDTKVKGDSLDAFVSNISKTLQNQVAIRNAEDESKFNTAVLESNLSLDDQLAYRKDQLERISDDPTERKRIRNEISNLNKRIVQKKFTDEYTGKLMDYESGLTSIDSVINYLNEQKSVTKDQSIIDSINNELVKKNADKFNLTKQLLQSQTEYAKNDKGIDIINNQLDNVTSAKTKALLAGDQNTASMLDLQIQSLLKAKNENEIAKDVKNFAVSTITGFASATKLLDSYNAKIANSSSDTPITIGDVTYSSPKEFWTFKRDSYIADQSSSGLFSRLNDEAINKIKVADSKNNLNTNLIADATKDISSLTGRPELAGYEQKIDSIKQGILQSGANLATDKITNTYSTDYDINKAMAEINSLKSLGVNVDSSFAKLLSSAASIKQGQVNNLLEAAKVAMTNNPSLTPEQALNEAIKTGASTVLSPQQLVSTPENKIASDFASKATNETGTVDPRLTAGGTQQPTTQPQQPVTQPQQPVNDSTGAYKTITIKSGDTLASIAQRELGASNKFSEIAALNNISDPNKIQAGAIIKIPNAQQTTQPTPTLNQPNQPVPIVEPTKPVITPAPAQPVATKPIQNNPAPSTYKGNSIVDYLSSSGKDTSFNSRSALATQSGIKNYQGTAEQNMQLLKTLRGF